MDGGVRHVYSIRLCHPGCERILQGRLFLCSTNSGVCGMVRIGQADPPTQALLLYDTAVSSMEQQMTLLYLFIR